MPRPSATLSPPTGRPFSPIPPYTTAYPSHSGVHLDTLLSKTLCAPEEIDMLPRIHT
ncbi:hypothetical protein SISSUDRAFT_1055041, partial [Sistotremastrum suecicum HHB10207 ss-3]